MSNLKPHKIVAIGDLHGDYYRLLRILHEQEIFIPGKLEWNPKANIDLVLLGDYVDWRGEPMEGAPEEWPTNIKRLLELIMFICDETERLNKELPGFTGRIHTLMGNHDRMMLDSFKILSRLSPFIGKMLLKRSGSGQVSFLAKLFNTLTGHEDMEDLLRVMNWYEQGGEMTINAYGGMQQWMDAMNGKLGSFISERLQIGTLLYKRLFVHSIPDNPDHWIPLHELSKLPQLTYESVIEGFTWGRRLWGVNIITGGKILPFTQEEIEEFLKRMNAEKVFVGHTPFYRTGPFFAYKGKVVDLDTHGVPDSAPYVEEMLPCHEPYEINYEGDCEGD